MNELEKRWQLFAKTQYPHLAPNSDVYMTLRQAFIGGAYAAVNEYEACTVMAEEPGIARLAQFKSDVRFAVGAEIMREGRKVGDRIAGEQGQ